MIVAISQPMYFPWIGFMEMMKLADKFIWLDDVCFSKGSFTNRIQVKLPTGVKWMTVPLQGKGTNTNICDLTTSNHTWRASHKAMLAQSFKDSPHADISMEIFDRAILPDKLVDCLIASCEEQAEALNCKPKRILRSSDMGISTTSWQRVIDIVKEVDGNHYISGKGGLRYLDHAAFEQNGIDVSYMDYNPAQWPQNHGAFTPYVTGLDLIAAKGDEAGSYLRPTISGWRDQLARQSK